MRGRGKLFAIFKSFYSATLYRDVFSQWRGIGLSYMMLLNFLIITPVLITSGFTLNKVLFEEKIGIPNALEFHAGGIIDQLPTLEWNGQSRLNVVDNKPHTIYFVRGDFTLPLVLIDNDATEESFSGDTPNIILNKDGILFRQSDSRTAKQDWNEFGFKHLYVDQVIAAKLASIGIKWLKLNRAKIYAVLGFGLWAFSMLLLLIWRLIQVLIYGAVAFGIANLMKIKTDYSTMMRIAAVAITPMIVTDAIIILSYNFEIPIFLSIVFVLIYLFYALRCNRDSGATET